MAKNTSFRPPVFSTTLPSLSRSGNVVTSSRYCTSISNSFLNQFSKSDACFSPIRVLGHTHTKSKPSFNFTAFILYYLSFSFQNWYLFQPMRTYYQKSNFESTIFLSITHSSTSTSRQSSTTSTQADTNIPNKAAIPSINTPHNK